VGRGDAVTAAAPSGVVTFLFTDIEGSTRRWESDADAIRAALLTHDEVLRTAIEAHDGFLFSATPGTGWSPLSHRPNLRWMRPLLLSGHWSCRCGWGSRPGKPNCATGITSARCSTALRG